MLLIVHQVNLFHYLGKIINVFNNVLVWIIGGILIHINVQIVVHLMHQEGNISRIILQVEIYVSEYVHSPHYMVMT